MAAFTNSATRTQWQRLGHGVLAAAGMSVLSALPGASQQPAGWAFRAPEGARAFYTVLADLPLSAIGPFRYYRSGGTRRGDPSLRTTISRPAFEVLHFVPLYAPSLDAGALAAALRAAGALTPANRPGTAFLDATLRGTLSAEERRALPAIASLVEAAAARLSPLSRPDVAALERRWRESFEPALHPFLEGERLTSGVVLVSESVAAEGRIFAGRPGDPGDNVIAVGSWPDSGIPDAPLLAMLRELCFPLVTRTVPLPPGGDRAAGSARSAFASVRCGARLADAVSPQVGVAYRALWSAAGPHPERGFDGQFPADAPVLAALDRSLGRGSPR